MLYLVNPKTRVIHIEGYCHYATKTSNLPFETEDDIFAQYGNSTRMCITCKKKIEQILKAAKK